MKDGVWSEFRKRGALAVPRCSDTNQEVLVVVVVLEMRKSLRISHFTKLNCKQGMSVLRQKRCDQCTLAMHYAMMDESSTKLDSPYLPSS